jgi:hypothetical protein
MWPAQFNVTMPPSRASKAVVRDELLNGEIFYTLKEAQIIIEGWRHYNTVRPHSALATSRQHPKPSSHCRKGQP